MKSKKRVSLIAVLTGIAITVGLESIAKPRVITQPTYKPVVTQVNQVKNISPYPCCNKFHTYDHAMQMNVTNQSRLTQEQTSPSFLEESITLDPYSPG